MASSGNFSTWNPLRTNQQTQTFSENNLRYSSTQTSTNPAVTGTFGVTSGKWYWEIKVVAEGNASNSVGVCRTSAGLESDTGALWNASGDVVFMYLAGGNKRTNATSSSYGNSWTTNDIMQVALDMDNGAVYFGKNNTYQNSGNPASGSSKTGAAFTNLADKGHIQAYSLVYNNGDQVVNFGQDDTFAGRETAEGNADANGFGAFKYAPPSGYLAMCSGNLPISSDIDPGGDDGETANPTKQFGVVTFTGTGTARTISGLGMQPDMIWGKRRDSSKRHYLVDSSRGFTKYLHPEGTYTEGTSSDGVTSATTDGFAIGGSLDYINGNTMTYVAWAWRANGGTTATNTDGALTSTVQANQAAGFSISLYSSNGSGQSFGHGLGATPDFFMVKKRDTQDRKWTGWHTGLTTATTGYIFWNETNGEQNDTLWNNTAPSSTVINVQVDTTEVNNPSGATYVCYAWRSIEGYSKFGKYIGNGNSNGPFIYTGFKPRLFVQKRIDSTGDWRVWDSERHVNNPNDAIVRWNTDGGEDTANGVVDFLSNGVKIRMTYNDMNANDGEFIYMAWADVPFKYNNAF